MPARSWWTIGWRNLGRHRRRTLLTAAGLGVGYFSVVILVGLSEGLTSEMIDGGTSLVTGQLQVHSGGFLPERSMHETIGGRYGTDVGALLAAVEADPTVSAAAPRVFGGGLVSGGANTTASIMVGVDMERELRAARIASTLARGRHPRSGEREIMIGTEMARRLALEPGDEAVVVAPASDGSLGNDLFIVVGVFSTGLQELDATYALLPIDVLQALLAFDADRVHEIAARIEDPWLAPEAAGHVAERLGSVGLDVEVQPWTTYRPEIAEYARLAEASYWIIVVIVFGMAIFGVANTMLMSTYERRREFALLLALGAAPLSIIGAVLAEALALGVLSLAGGVLVTVPVLVWWHRAPIDLSGLVGGFTMAGGFVRPVLRVEYPIDMLWLSGIALFVTAVLAAIYPAIRASHLPPADTMAGR
jgi:putative ABC transport system permease protein